MNCWLSQIFCSAGSTCAARPRYCCLRSSSGTFIARAAGAAGPVGAADAWGWAERSGWDMGMGYSYEADEADAKQRSFYTSAQGNPGAQIAAVAAKAPRPRGRVSRTLALPLQTQWPQRMHLECSARLRSLVHVDAHRIEPQWLSAQRILRLVERLLCHEAQRGGALASGARPARQLFELDRRADLAPERRTDLLDALTVEPETAHLGQPADHRRRIALRMGDAAADARRPQHASIGSGQHTEAIDAQGFQGAVRAQSAGGEIANAGRGTVRDAAPLGIAQQALRLLQRPRVILRPRISLRRRGGCVERIAVQLGGERAAREQRRECRSRLRRRAQ